MRAVLRPSCLEELFAQQEQHPGAIPMAGGTDLLVRLRGADLSDERPLLSLADVTELQGIRNAGECLSIGAAETFSRIMADGLIRAHAPLLASAVRHVGGPAIRNMGSIGGNICTASPAGDSLPPLYLLDAELEVASPKGTRRQAVNEFITGPGQTSLADGEVVTRIMIPVAAGFTSQYYEKVGRRRSMAISVTSFAGLARLSNEGRLEEARFAWGSVGPTVVRLPQLEQELVGKKLNSDVIQQAAGMARSGVSPIDDIRAGADYRRSVSANLLSRFLEEILG